MKVWITKFALTRGILVAETIGEVQDNIVRVPKHSGFHKGRYHSGYYSDTEWYRTEEEAVAHAEKLRDTKLRNLRRQIDKLEKMQFGEDLD
jgi:hypothetical protein